MGFTITGTEEYFKISSTTPDNLSGPREQLRPTASAPAATSVTATADGVLPFIVNPFSSNESVTVTGTATAQGSFDITTTCVKGFSNSFSKYTDGYPGAAGDVKNSTCTVNGETATFNVEFGYPGSYQYYTLQFKNTGTMDALFLNDSDLYEKATGTMKVYLHSDNSLYKTITLPDSNSNTFTSNLTYFASASSLLVKTDGTILEGGQGETGRIVELSGVEYVRIKPNETLEIIVITMWPDNDNNYVKDYYAITTYNQNFEFKQYTMDAVDKDDGVLCIGGC